MKDQTGTIGEMLKILKRVYPHPKTALNFNSPFQILVATILSAQCTDAKVNEITPGLFARYGTASDFARADRSELEEAIRPTGFFRNKTKSIIGSSQVLVREFDGKVPDSMDALLTLPGVARKTANIVLSSGFGKAEGIAVDTHVKRLSGRLGLSREKNPDKIERDLMAVIPKEEWLHFNYRLVNHGRAVCQAKKPDCPHCPLDRLCPKIGVSPRGEGHAG